MELGKFIGYKCMICNKKYKKYSSWIEKHFIKKHNNNKIYLKRLYKK